MSPVRFRWSLVAMAVGVAGLTMLGAGVPATYGAHTTADEPQYLLSALSLWEDGNLDISDELSAGRYRQFHEASLPEQTRPLPDGRRVSPHSPLLPVLMAVPMGLGGWVAAKASLAMMGGALAALMLWVAHRRLDIRLPVAVVVVAVFALSPPLAVYATQVYPELPAALVVTAALAALTGRPGVRSMTVATAAVAALPWLAVKFVPVAALVAVATLVRAPRRARGWILAALVLAGAAFVAIHSSVYGGLTPYAAGDHFIGGEFTAVGASPDLWGRATRMVGLLVDRGFGVGAWQPAYLLLPVAVGSFRLGAGGGQRLLLGLVAVGWLVAGFLALTMHGWWFPGRQLVVVLPAAVLLIARWADRAPGRLRAAGMLGAVGMSLFGFLVGQGWAGDLTWAVDFASTAHPLYRAYAPLLPDYMDPSLGTWIRHGVWLVVLVVLGTLGRRRVPGSVDPPRAPVLERERHAV